MTNSCGLAVQEQPSYWELAPLVAASTHFIDIRRGEQRLEDQFGDEYRQHRAKVHR